MCEVCFFVQGVSNEKILFLVCTIILVGCSYPEPMRAANGYIYYISTDECKKYKYDKSGNSDVIECFDKDGNSTGLRRPMTQAELNFYAYQSAVAAQNFQNSLNNFNNNLNRINQEQQQRNQMLFQQNMRMLEQDRLNHNIQCIGKPFCTMY